MGIRSQLQCKQCGKRTLHEQDPATVNHVLHLLITVLLIGIWLPVWILIAIAAPIRHMRCLTCGHSATEETHKEATAAKQESIELYRQYEESRRAAAAKARTDWIRGLFGSIGGVVSAIITNCDNALQRSTGDDIFMLWMLRIMVLSVAITSGSAAIFFTARFAGFI